MQKKHLATLVLGFLGFICSFGQPVVERIEPPNWWVDMKWNAVELLIYGKEVGLYRPQVDYPGIQIREVKTVQNLNYLFLTLFISPETPAGNVPIQFFNGKEPAGTHNWQLLDRVPGRRQIQGFDGSDALYLITPDRFANGDPKNDYVTGMMEQPDRSKIGGRHGGDLKGISDHLDYIRDLGFTAIWLNPVLENDMPEYSYHGYAATDFYRVDPRYGTNEEYRNFVQNASEKGMKVIMDMIVNHIGLHHWWMKDLPQPSWINQWETYTQTNHRKTVILDPYASAIDKKTFTDGWFVKTMPDLNQRNASLARYLIQNSIWWVEYSGVAGIRMDTYPYPDMHFMRDWTKALMQEYPDFNIVGEEWFGLPTVVSYWQKGKENPNGYTSELKSLMDFPLQVALVESLSQDDLAWTTSWDRVYNLLSQDYLYPAPENLVIFPDNHDMSRIFTQIGEDFNDFRLAMAFFATMRGIPQVYYGTEILMANPGTTDHGIIRSDFPGGWEADPVNGFSGYGLTDRQKEAKELVRTLYQWRKTKKVIHDGRLMHYSPVMDGLYVFFRYDNEESVMVILNKSGKETRLDTGRFSERLSGFKSGRDVLSGTEFRLDQQIIVPAHSPLILELNP